MKNRIKKFLTHLNFLGRKTAPMGVAGVSIFFAALAFGQVKLPTQPTDPGPEGENYAARLHIYNGLTAMAEGHFYHAKGEFEFVIHREFDNRLRSVAYLNLGVISFMEDNPDQAIKYYQSAIQLIPDYVDAYFNMGAAYYKQEDLKKAEEAFLKAIELQPNYGRAHYSLGAVYLDQKKYDLAWKHAEKAAEYGIPYKSLKEKLAKVKSRS